jgi:hypothetical protein
MKCLEDYLINKLNGYHLILYSKDYHNLAMISFWLSTKIINTLVFFHLVSKRIEK